MSTIRNLAVISLLFATTVKAGETMIHFDMPPIVSARQVGSAGNESLVAIELKLSSMITAADLPRIDQWIVHCQPRNSSLQIADYAPRTEVASDIDGPIQIKKTNERTDSVGVSLDGSYGPIARFHSGADRGRKDVDSYQLDRVAPVQAVTASGTINRGRGVFYKLRWTAQQVLEGEKSFQVTLRVPSTWRGSLIDVSVIAQSKQKSFAGWDSDIKVLGAATFVVAAYLEGDQDAADQANALFDAEQALRVAARRHPKESGSSLMSLVRHVTMPFDDDKKRPSDSWIQRLLFSEADPHHDKEITKLPMPVRLAVLDYVDTRDDFLAINTK